MFLARCWDALVLGLRDLAAHRLRSSLAALGIVLGVASVIVMLAVGEAARYQALKQLEDLGANTILLRSMKRIRSAGPCVSTAWIGCARSPSSA
jgi:putative ABC transport system permease protein